MVLFLLGVALLKIIFATQEIMEQTKKFADVLSPVNAAYFLLPPTNMKKNELRNETDGRVKSAQPEDSVVRFRSP